MFDEKHPKSLIACLGFSIFLGSLEEGQHGQVVLLPFMVFMLMVCEIGCVHPIGFGLIWLV
jgi:hypothetical protein